SITCPLSLPVPPCHQPPLPLTSLSTNMFETSLAMSPPFTVQCFHLPHALFNLAESLTHTLRRTATMRLRSVPLSKHMFLRQVNKIISCVISVWRVCRVEKLSGSGTIWN
ncbi:hypothetical protein C0992_009681, partial [Termitomyces sp. T32_za158]